jgi:hypothetical protein
MNITGTLTSDKLPVFYLSQIGPLGPRHACLGIKTRVFMPRDSFASPSLRSLLANVVFLTPSDEKLTEVLPE